MPITPRYLVKNRHNNYYLRFIIPFKLLNDSIIRLESRYSLKTKDIHSALSIYAASIQDIKRIICMRDFVKNSLAEAKAELLLVNSGIKETLNTRIDRLVETSSENKNHWKTKLAERSLKNSVTEIMVSMLTHTISESVDAEQKVTQTTKSLNDSKAQNEKLLELLKASLPSSESSPSKVRSDNKPLHELLNIYLDERKPALAEKTFSEESRLLDRFLEIIGYDRLSKEINNDCIDQYCFITKSVPPNFSNHLRVEKPTNSDELQRFWKEAAENNVGQKLKSKGVEKHFSCVRAFLGWCYGRNNVAQDYRIYPSLMRTKGVKDSVIRTPFSEEQLKTIFTSYIFSAQRRQREQPKDFHFWLPLIALTTGMRIAEIVGIEKKDVIKKQGIWVFNLNDTWQDKKRKTLGYNKSKKNQSSCRIVPIPQVLIDMGLLDYLNALRSDSMIFPDLALGKHKGLGDYASKWFNERFLSYIGIDKRSPDGKSKVSFHSFRHTFVTNISKTVINGNTLNESEQHYVTGHEQQGERNKTYNHGGVDYPRVKKFMDEIDFGFDLTELSFHKFKRRKSWSK